MNYRILNSEDVIQEGDEWRDTDGWDVCRYSIGHTVEQYRQKLNNSRWQARRPIKCTALGNSL